MLKEFFPDLHTNPFISRHIRVSPAFRWAYKVVWRPRPRGQIEKCSFPFPDRLSAPLTGAFRKAPSSQVFMQTPLGSVTRWTLTYTPACQTSFREGCTVSSSLSVLFSCPCSGESLSKAPRMEETFPPRCHCQYDYCSRMPGGYP